MIRVLVVDDEPDLRELIRFSLESDFAVYVEEASSAKEAIELIRQDPSWQVVICDYRMERDKGSAVFHYLEEQSLSIPFILCTATPLEQIPELKEKPLACHLEKPFFIEKLVQYFEETFGESFENKEYVPVRLRTISELQQLPCDLFLKINEEKSIKLFHQGEVLAPEDLQHYRDKGVDRLFVRKNDSKQLFEKMLRNFVSQHEVGKLIESDEAIHQLLDRVGDEGLREDMIALRDSEKNNSEKTFEISKSVFEKNLKLMGRFGFSADVQKVVQSSVGLVVDRLRGSPKLSQQLQIFEVDPESYLVSHSVAAAFLASGIAQLVGWGGEKDLLRLGLAAFLHDLPLEGRSVARCQRLNDLAGGEKYSAEDIQAFGVHPAAAAKLAREVPDWPSDLDTIIFQHHERPDGSGFPKGIKGRAILPLSTVLIVAHDLVCFSEEHPEEAIDHFIVARRNLYGEGRFKKILNALAISLSDGTNQNSGTLTSTHA